MQAALDLARTAAGKTGDNPAVGCLLVKGGAVIGRGVTGDGGRPHGEIMALRDCKAAGHDPRGAAAYVTLEPCSHTGRSGPCADALIAAGITGCVIASRDPNPLVNGGGIAKLNAAGISVRTGLLDAEARAINPNFFTLFER